LAVGVIGEESAAIGVNGDQMDDSNGDTGAVYVLKRTNGVWQQLAYLKATNADTGSRDNFGRSVSLSVDGSVLVVGAPVVLFFSTKQPE